MFCGSLHYNYFYNGNINNKGITRTSEYHSFRKEVQDSKGANTCPTLFCHLKRMYEPQYICDKYFLTLLI